MVLVGNHADHPQHPRMALPSGIATTGESMGPDPAHLRMITSDHASTALLAGHRGAVAHFSRILGLSAAGLLFSLFALQSFVGYADNGDFHRSMGFALAKPSDFESMWERVEGQGNADRFHIAWHDRWDVRDEFVPVEGRYPRTTYKLFLTAQIAVSALISGSPDHYSVVLGSLLSRALLLIAFLGLAREVQRRTSKATAFGFAVVAAAVMLDGTFAGLLNSFYEEQMSILILPFLAWSFMAFLRAPSLGLSLLILALAACLGGAKTAYFYLPAMVLPLIFSMRNQRRHWPLLLAAFAMAQFASTQPLLTSEFPKTNAYHSMYFGALHHVPEERLEALSASGQRFDAECIGVAVFMPGGPGCRDQVDVSHADTALLLMRNPDLGIRMMWQAALGGSELRPVYLSQRMHDATDFSMLLPFNLMRAAFSGYYHVMAISAAVLSLILLVRRRAGRVSTLLATGLALAVFGVSQYAVSLADGYYELVKHLLVANFALALSTAFLFPGLVVAMRDSLVGNPSSVRSTNP